MARPEKPKAPTAGAKPRARPKKIPHIPRTLAQAKRLGYLVKPLGPAEIKAFDSTVALKFVVPSASRGHLVAVLPLPNGHWKGKYEAADGSFFYVESESFPADDV